MSLTDQRESIVACLAGFATRPLPEAAREFFRVLGYASDRRLTIATPKQFIAQLDPHGKVTDRERESLGGLTSLHFLFQLTDAEFQTHDDLFVSKQEVQTTRIESYLFFAAELPPGTYTRTALSTLVRAINKPLPMPALVLFKHGDTLSLGIIHRRLHKRDQARDVLEKVTLIKDAALADPIRAHIEILNDFVFDNLAESFGVATFVQLHEAWQKRLGSYALSNDFYREIADWYFWAHHQVEAGTIRLPEHCDTEQEKSLFLIRLLTRLIFCWFLIEKRLIPSALFRSRELMKLLKNVEADQPTFYHAVLQNLFFGTLNMPPENRAFREKKKGGERYDQNYGITNLWRYESDFRDAALWKTLAAKVPFLNGGLFDCLDDKTGKKKDNFILDGFSDNPKLACHLPNDLFFGPERTVDLSKDYGEEDKRTARSKKAKVRGLIEILSRYKFTIEENTPLEEEIALDPELLGKVFENLLASYNEDTRTTARKALGAFYTPREIVSYMVDEALKSYLSTQVPRCKSLLDLLFSNKPEGLLKKLEDTAPGTKDALIAAIGRVKILDPACGSGAFPMGALHRLVDLLQKLDPNNESWKRDRLAEARRYRKLLEESGSNNDELAACDARITDIEKSFDNRFHALDFARKLYLIENCIYGVDIQPIATQIAKLRFFISLVVDQKVEATAPNLGVRPLPNLETRLVAADTLIPIEKSESDLFSSDLDRLRAELADIRHQHFNARSPSAKRKWREADEAKRAEIAAALEKSHALSKDAARKLAAWDPYDQNTFAPFFDPEWMFGLPVGKVRLEGKAPATLLGNLALINEAGGQTELIGKAPREIDSGFDVVIGNPPYLDSEGMKTSQPKAREFIQKLYSMTKGNWDMYIAFYERAFSLIHRAGFVTFITPDKWIAKPFGDALRLGTHAKLVSILRAGREVFQSVNVDAIVTLYGNEERHDFRVYDFEDGVVKHKRTIQKAALKPPYAYDWLFSRWYELLQRLELQEHHLGDFGDCENACATSDAYKLKGFIQEFSDSDEIGDFFCVINTGTIGKYASRWGRREMVYLGDRYHRPVVKRSIFLREFPNSYGKKAPTPKLIAKGLNLLDVCIDADGAVIPGKTTLIVTAHDSRILKVLLGVLNSTLPVFYIREKNPAYSYNQGTTFTKEMINSLPFPRISDLQADTLVEWVELLRTLSQFSEAQLNSTRDPLMVAYWERVLNGLVYELYFPEELHAAGLQLFDLVDAAALPDITKLPEADRLPRLRQKFEELHDGAHPLRIVLDKLQTLDTIRIIEGKE